MSQYLTYFNHPLIYIKGVTIWSSSLFLYFTSEIVLLDFAGVNLTKWDSEYEEFVAEDLSLSLKSLLLGFCHWVWRACCWGFQATKYGLIEPAVGSKYELVAKYKWDCLAIVIFWKVIDVLDYFHVKLYGDSFWENSYLL